VTAELRAWVEIDSMQPQWAAYVAQTCQGDPPHAGMAQLYVEVAPASRVFALVNAAVKHARVRSALVRSDDEHLSELLGLRLLHADLPHLLDDGVGGAEGLGGKGCRNSEESDSREQPEPASHSFSYGISVDGDQS